MKDYEIEYKISGKPYIVSYRFSEKGKWYIYKDCKEDNLQAVLENAFLIPDVVEVKIGRKKG